jgi:hypothetical protein
VDVLGYFFLLPETKIIPVSSLSDVESDPENLGNYDKPIQMLSSNNTMWAVEYNGQVQTNYSGLVLVSKRYRFYWRFYRDIVKAC